MASLADLESRIRQIERTAQYVLRDLPDDTPQPVRSLVEVIEAEARTAAQSAYALRASLRAQIDA